VDREEFNSFLERANLSKKEFCQIIELNYNTVNNWGSKNISVPKWVKSWLENYIEKKNHEKLKQALKNSGVCDNK
jgi:DNA-binding transcriptional regulator YiaG